LHVLLIVKYIKRFEMCSKTKSFTVFCTLMFIEFKRFILVMSDEMYCFPGAHHEIARKSSGMVSSGTHFGPTRR